MRLAASRTFCTAGKSRPISTAMIAMTTSNSISVNARRRHMGPPGALRHRTNGTAVQLGDNVATRRPAAMDGGRSPPAGLLHGVSLEDGSDVPEGDAAVDAAGRQRLAVGGEGDDQKTQDALV